MKFDVWVFFESMSWKTMFLWNLTWITGNLREDMGIFILTFGWITLRIRNVSEECCRETENTHLMLKDFFGKSCRLWDNVEKYGRAVQATHGMHVACRITKAENTHTHTHTHSECVIFITFLRLRESASLLRLYTHCRSCFEFVYVS